MPAWQAVDNLVSDADVLRRRRYGIIEIENELLKSIHLRPYPKMISLSGVAVLGGHTHNSAEGNRCWIYYNQPFRHSQFLVLKYIVSSRGSTFQTVRAALMVLDEIARIKRSDAILSEVTNLRISDRLLNRWGWEPHVPSSCRRHFIKRFYGKYPAPDSAHARIPGLPKSEAH